jgi:hypothetical protein
MKSIMIKRYLATCQNKKTTLSYDKIVKAISMRKARARLKSRGFNVIGIRQVEGK